MLWLIFQLYSFISVNPDYTKELIVREATIQRAESLNGIQYNLWGHLKNNNRTDCSGLFVRFGIILDLWWDSFRARNNSYKIYKRGASIPYYKAKKGDNVFFLPLWSGTNHIAFVSEDYSEGNLEIIDFIKGSTTERRKLKTYKCWSNLCYSVPGKWKWKLMFSESVFVTELKKAWKINTDYEIKNPQKSCEDEQYCNFIKNFWVDNTKSTEELKEYLRLHFVPKYVKSLSMTKTSVSNLNELIWMDWSELVTTFEKSNTDLFWSGITYNSSDLSFFRDMHYGLNQVKILMVTDVGVLNIF